jgi:hypothetical protein
MNDYRAAGQELQGQVLAAARKGQERVTKSVKNVTAAAQQIRPQLASLPKQALNLSPIPGPAQLREKTPDLVAKLPVKLPTKLQTRLPSPEQLRAGAQELAGHARSVQRLVTDQVLNVATPLAHQAAARLAQVGMPAANSGPKAGPTTRVSRVTVTRDEKAAGAPAKSSDQEAPTTARPTTARPTTAKPTTARPTTAKPSTTKPSTTKPSTTKASTTKASTAKPSTAKPKPKPGPADK